MYAYMVPSCADQLRPQILMEQFDTMPIQYRHIEHMHEGVWLKKKTNIFDKTTAMRTKTIFPYMAFVYALIVPSWADQLLPQLLKVQFETLLIQC